MEPDAQKRKREETEQSSRSKFTKTIHGWRANAKQPDYEALLDTLTDLFVKHAFAPDGEVEVRLGHFVSRQFNPGVSEEFFNRIMDHLSQNVDWTSGVHYEQHRDYSNAKGQRLRLIEDHEPQIVSKKRLAAVDVQCRGAPFDFRVSFAKEKNLPYTESLAAAITAEATNSRFKDRVSYLYKTFAFELSVVTDVKGSNERRVDTDGFEELPGEDGGAVYEIELELRFESPGPVATDRMEAMRLAESMILKVIDLMYFLEELDPAKIQFEVNKNRKR